jgi:hypothetical protein
LDSNKSQSNQSQGKKKNSKGKGKGAANQWERGGTGKKKPTKGKGNGGNSNVHVMSKQNSCYEQSEYSTLPSAFGQLNLGRSSSMADSSQVIFQSLELMQNMDFNTLKRIIQQQQFQDDYQSIQQYNQQQAAFGVDSQD